VARDQQPGRSLLVATYRTAELALRPGNDGTLDNPSRAFPTPMGLAVGGNDRAMGTVHQIRASHSLRAVARLLEPAPARPPADFASKDQRSVGYMSGFRRVGFDRASPLGPAGLRARDLAPITRRSRAQ
jgi:hypothetical protein